MNKDKVDRTSPGWWGKYHQLLAAKFGAYGDFANDPLLEELAKAEGLASAFPSANRIQRAANIISEAKARYYEALTHMHAEWFAKAPVFLRDMKMVHIGACQLAAEKNSGPKKSKPVQRVKGSRSVDTGFAWLAESARSVEIKHALDCSDTTLKSYKARLPSSLQPIAQASGTKSAAGRFSRSAVIMLLKFRLDAKSRQTAKMLAREILAKQQGIPTERYYQKGLAELKATLRPFLE